jgi:DNA-binding NtrC family response regulator
MTRPQRLILIEPDAGVRDALERLLNVEGREVRSLVDASTLGALIDKGGVDVVISEFSLPDISAPKLLETLAEQQIPVIFTGHDFSLQGAMDLIRQGALDFLEKPFSRTRLLDLLSGLHKGQNE